MGLARRRPASGVALGGQAGFSPEAADALSGQSPTGTISGLSTGVHTLGVRS